MIWALKNECQGWLPKGYGAESPWDNLSEGIDKETPWV